MTETANRNTTPCEVVTISPKQRKSLSEHRGSPLSLSSDSAVANLSDDEVVSEAGSHSKLRRASSGIWSFEDDKRKSSFHRQAAFSEESSSDSERWSNSMDHSDKPVHQRTDEWKNGNFVQTHARPRYCNLERCTSLQAHHVRGLVSYFNSAPLGRQNSGGDYSSRTHTRSNKGQDETDSPINSPVKRFHQFLSKFTTSAKSDKLAKNKSTSSSPEFILCVSDSTKQGLIGLQVAAGGTALSVASIVTLSKWRTPDRQFTVISGRSRDEVTIRTASNKYLAAVFPDPNSSPHLAVTDGIKSDDSSYSYNVIRNVDSSRGTRAYYFKRNGNYFFIDVDTDAKPVQLKLGEVPASKVNQEEYINHRKWMKKT